MKILILNKKQFGYHLGFTHYLIKHSPSTVKYIYLGLDQKFKKIEHQDCEIYYQKQINKIFDSLFFYFQAFHKHFKSQPNLIFVNYFPFCSILLLFLSRKRTILDIRTGSVHTSIYKRKFYNSLLRFEASIFNNVTIISSSLKSHLKIKNSAEIFPLGAEIEKDLIPNRFQGHINLLYVGTLNGRKIEKTIQGLKNYLEKYRDTSKIKRYDIIGEGYKNELEGLQNLIKDNKLENLIFLHGFKHHNELHDFYKKANIGVSFIPVTDIYDFQPPTKTYEYILKGIPVLATATFENQKIVHFDNGQLIEDNAKSFAEGLDTLVKRYINNEINHRNVQKSLEQYNWSNIVLLRCLPYFNQVLQNVR